VPYQTIRLCGRVLMTFQKTSNKVSPVSLYGSWDCASADKFATAVVHWCLTSLYHHWHLMIEQGQSVGFYRLTIQSTLPGGFSQLGRFF